MSYSADSSTDGFYSKTEFEEPRATTEHKETVLYVLWGVFFLLTIPSIKQSLNEEKLVVLKVHRYTTNGMEALSPAGNFYFDLSTTFNSNDRQYYIVYGLSS